MNIEWNKYTLSSKMIFDSKIEYILIIAKNKKILISYKTNIKIFNIMTLKEEGEIILGNEDPIENLYLLKNELISIISKNDIYLIKLFENNTYELYQKLEFEENIKHLIELKNLNLCIVSLNNIYIYSLKNDNKYINLFTLKEDFQSYEKGLNESCIELIYEEKNIKNKIAVFLYNAARLSFWDLNKKEKINDTKNNNCNTYDNKNIFCLMDKGKYLLCACIDESIHFYSTEKCVFIKTLQDPYWHISVLKLGENQILSGGDFGTITYYEFDFNSEIFNNDEKYLDMDDTKKIEKQIDREDEEEIIGHEKCISEIYRLNNTIISTSCYEKDKYTHICFWNKKL